jgi:anti-anti-sigma regulatory factor
MRIRLGGGIQHLRARLEPDEPFFELAMIEGKATIRGDCDVACAASIDAWLATFGRAAIDVDLSGVTFLDAASLRALLGAVRRNPNLRIVRPSPVVQPVLDLTDTASALVEGTTA